MALNLNHHFLIAMPGLEDAYFKKSLIYILQHDSDGCIGVIVNKPVATKISQIIPDIEMEYPNINPDMALNFGGPVAMDQGLVVQAGAEESDNCINNGFVSFSNSMEILKQVISSGSGPDFIICMGYSGWSEGQLENELKENAWLPVSADFEILFHEDPYKKYDLALRKLGIDPAMMSQSGGNA